MNSDDLKSTKEEQNMEEYIEQLQRLQAEFINYRNRIEKEKKELIENANEKLILNLLDVIDNFDRALKSIKDKDTKKGIEMIYKQLNTVLKNQGLTPINSIGQKFNPYEHEAVLKEESKQEENVIIEEFQKGYKLKDKIIRPSKVKISGGKKNEQNNRN